MLIKPISRVEHFLARIAGDSTALVLEPQTRVEHFLQRIIDNGGPSPGPGGGMTEDVKQAFLNAFSHVAWTDEHGQDYYEALEAAFYPPADLVSISAVYTQSGIVYDTDSLDDLKSDLVVTALYGDESTQTVPAESYTLSGTLTEGTSTITVSYGGKTTTFDVIVSAIHVPTEYQRVEWIGATRESDTVGQHIITNTQFSGNGIAVITAIACPSATATNNQVLAGCVETANTANQGAVIGFNREATSAYAFNGAYSIISPNNGASIVDDFKKYTATLQTGSASISDGANNDTNEGTTRSYSGKNINIFMNAANGPHYHANAKLSYLKIEENGTLLAELIPCYRKSDGVIGLYDTVNEQFYTNSGSGTFTKGADV